MQGLPGSWPDPFDRRGTSPAPGRPAPGAYSDLDADGDRPPRPPVWRRAIGTRTTAILLIVAAVVVILTLVRSRSSGGPTIATNCAVPGLVAAPLSVRQYDQVRYAVTGPPTGTYALAVDASDVRPAANGRLTAIPVRPGVQAQPASRPGTLTDCSGSGGFTVAEPAGKHTLTLFRIDGDHATAVASVQLTVR